MCKKLLSKEEFIEKARKIHGNKFDYSLVEFNKITDKIIIICQKHGTFKQRADSHFKHSCRKCQDEIKSKNTRMKSEDVIKQFKKIHKNKYDYSLVNYINKRTKVKIICPNHGIFYQIPYEHKNGNGCSVCGMERMKISKLKNKEWIDKCINKYKNKYDYSLVNYITDRINVKIICPIHGELNQKPKDHYKTGCGLCNKIQKSLTNSQIFIEKCKKIYDGKYDYSLVSYINNKTKVKIICHKHGVFEQRPDLHLRHGCPSCNQSRGEIKIRILLDNLKINYLYQYKFENCKNIRQLPFDFYLPDYNTCIEFDGKQHYESIKYFGGQKNLLEIKMKDEIKNFYCENNNIKLIRVGYKEDVNKKLKSILEQL